VEKNSYQIKKFYLCEKHRIKRYFSITKTSQQNGALERMNRTIQQMACDMLHESGAPHTLWGEAAHASVNILNKALSM